MFTSNNVHAGSVKDSGKSSGDDNTHGLVSGVASAANADVDTRPNESSNSSRSTSTQIRSPHVESDTCRDMRKSESFPGAQGSNNHPCSNAGDHRDEGSTQAVPALSGVTTPASSPPDIFTRFAATDIWMCGLVFFEVLASEQLGDEKWDKYVHVARQKCEAGTQTTAMDELITSLRQILSKSRKRKPFFKPDTPFEDGCREWYAAYPSRNSIFCPL